MGSGKWGVERSTEQAFLRMGKGEREREEEDHVAGLVKQIAHAMLEEDEAEKEDDRDCSSWGSNLSSQASGVSWSNSGIGRFGIRPLSVHGSAETEALELLYMELVQLKMNELAIAQQQLSLYQKSLVGARQTSYSSVASIDGLPSMGESFVSAEQKKPYFGSSYFQQCHGQNISRDWDWVSSRKSQSYNSKQRPESPLAYATGKYPERGIASSGMSVMRDSGGTGVFLPRCRTGARNLRNLESKQRTDYT